MPQAHPSTFGKKLDDEVMELYRNREVTAIKVPISGKPLEFFAVIEDGMAIVNGLIEIWFLSEEEYEIV